MRVKKTKFYYSFYMKVNLPTQFNMEKLTSTAKVILTKLKVWHKTSTNTNLKVKVPIQFYRYSYQSCSIERGVLKNFTKFTGKHLCQSLRPATLLRKRVPKLTTVFSPISGHRWCKKETVR